MKEITKVLSFEELAFLLNVLVKTKLNLAITGRANSGRRPFLVNLINYIDPRCTLSVYESLKDKELREIYPTRNIISTNSVDFINSWNSEHFMKHDSYVTILDEVASYNVAASAVNSMLCGKQTIFTHHASTTKDLISILRNALINNGNFNDMLTPQCVLIDQLRVDIHLDCTTAGDSYVARITEIVPIADKPGEFNTVDIIKYDIEKQQYMLLNMFSNDLMWKVHKTNIGAWETLRHFFIRLGKSEDSRQNFIKHYFSELEPILSGLVEANVTLGVTGNIGTGKTTILSGLVAYTDPRYTVRVCEEYSELELEKLYPQKNIISGNVSALSNLGAAKKVVDCVKTLIETGQEFTMFSHHARPATDLIERLRKELLQNETIQNNVKKYKPSICVVGELCTDESIDYAVENMRTSPIATMFTHHARTSKDLVYSLRNAILNTGMVIGVEEAEKLIANLLHIDIHVERLADGTRFISRISEIVATKVGFETVDLVRYDEESGTYYAPNRISYLLEEHIKVRNCDAWNKIDTFLRGLNVR